MDFDRPRFFSAWDLLAMAGLGLLWGICQWTLPRLPDPVPTHFNAAGLVDGWTPKGQMNNILLVLFALPAGLWALLFFLGSLLALSQTDPARARVMAIHPMRSFVSFGASLLMGSGFLTPLLGLASLRTGVALAVLCVILGVVFTSMEAQRFLAHEPDAAHYRWGVFYVNPADPRLWVPKRVGYGMTLNFARPAAYAVTLLIILILLGVLAVVQQSKH